MDGAEQMRPDVHFNDVSAEGFEADGLIGEGSTDGALSKSPGQSAFSIEAHELTAGGILPRW